MSDVKHTPGPWIAQWMEGSTCFGIRSPERTVAYTRQSGKSMGAIRREHEANARLIAAAPELLAALKKLHDAIDSCVALTPGLLAECRAIIAKAEGGAA